MIDCPQHNKGDPTMKSETTMNAVVFEKFGDAELS
jgi:hypothetical protein